MLEVLRARFGLVVSLSFDVGEMKYSSACIDDNLGSNMGRGETASIFYFLCVSDEIGDLEPNASCVFLCSSTTGAEAEFELVLALGAGVRV